MDRQSFVQNGAQKYNGARSSLSGWLTTPQGAYVLDWELAQFDSAVDDVFGFRAVQIGLPEVDFLRQNRINFRFSLALEPGAALAADPLQLPLASQSVDLVVLPHVLEGHHNPHEVLREAERVLMPEGHIVISGFNTLSLWRVRQVFSGRGGGGGGGVGVVGRLPAPPLFRFWFCAGFSASTPPPRHGTRASSAFCACATGCACWASS
jgi:SAM-dependent methyltransferase